MKTKLFIGILVLIGIGTELFGTAGLGHSRWRNDDGDETTATWKTAEDDSLVQNNEGNIRLRMEILTTTYDAFALEAFLYYASLKDTVYHLVSDDESDAFNFYNSPNLTNGGATTGQLTVSEASCLTQAGIIREASGSFDLSMSDYKRKEYEFSIKPTSNVEYEQSYVFLIEDSDPIVLSYVWDIEDLPRIYMEKPMLTVTADDASRSAGTDNPAFAVSYSGFVDGDDESVLDVPPNISCSANSGSAAGTYDIVPYGAEDNKYNFTFITGELTVNALSGIHDIVNNGINIYPNPAIDFIYINGNNTDILTAKIYNLTGSVVLESTINNSQIDIRSLRKGIYILNLNGEVFKISKQ